MLVKDSLNNKYSCLRRPKMVPNCAIHEPDTAYCLSCAESYQLTSLKNCLRKILKCDEHISLLNASQKETLLCKKCLPGFYVKTITEGDSITTSCEIPSVLLVGCVRYQAESQCIECRQKYYLANFTCHLMDSDIIS